jgi:aspartyl protease family protein
MFVLMNENRPRADDLPSRVGKAMLVGAWIVGLTILVLLFHRLVSDQQNPNRDVVALEDPAGRPQVMLARNRVGHYVADGRINGRPVTFLVDTGATDVALPLAVARRLDLPLGAPRVSRTANGDVQVWSARLESVDLGGLTVRGVRAAVLPNMPGDEVLLGMSYLKHFELIQRDGTLSLRPLR